MKKKPSKKDIFRAWGLPETFKTNHLRYKNPIEKGIYWFLFSMYVRQRDVEKWGTCISCGRRITVESSDAGHFMPAGSCGRDLLFDPVNVNAECSQCNAWDETHLLGYADNLDKRYGKGTALELRKRRQAYKDCKTPTKDWTAKEYGEKIRQISPVKVDKA